MEGRTNGDTVAEMNRCWMYRESLQSGHLPCRVTPYLPGPVWFPWPSSEHLPDISSMDGAQQLGGGSLQEWGGNGTAPLLLLPLPSPLLSPPLPYLPLQHTWGCDISWDMIESKDLLLACYSGKTPTGISEPLNSTACCKWNCLLCSVRAGYSQLSLLTQLHEISPSCHPTLLHSLGPALFPLKCWGKNGAKIAPPSSSEFWILNSFHSWRTTGESERWRQQLRHCVGCIIYTALAAMGDLSPGSAVPVAHPSEEQQIKPMEWLKVSITAGFDP